MSTMVKDVPLRICAAISAVYVALLIALLAFGDSGRFVEVVAFAFANCIVSWAAIYLLYHKRPVLIVHWLYAWFLTVYIWKAIVLGVPFVSPNYAVDTAIALTNSAMFPLALVMVTAAHVLLVFLTWVVGMVANQRKTYKADCAPSLSELEMLLAATGLWIIVSSAVMFYYGVAIMGSEGVSLPFKLSGVLYYSRTIGVPLVMVYILEKAIVARWYRIVYTTIAVLVCFAMSEVVIRASKSPLAVIALYVVALWTQLRACGISAANVVTKRLLVMAVVGTIIVFPVIEAYRQNTISASPFAGRGVAVEEMLVQIQDMSEASSGLKSLQMLVSRAEGFTEFLGLISSGGDDHSWSDLRNYRSISEYYTRFYLGNSTIGHAASPSLLGAAVIVGGMHWWPAVFIGWCCVMVVLWCLADKFTHLGMAIKAQLIFETANTVMAGTMDDSGFRIALLLAGALVVETILNVMEKGAVLPMKGRVVGKR